ncbi:MAG TPA: aspartyl protease family protein [Chthoniobacterales bacterium]|nr:aspartyl protease family protein [Chthoniobacterales bacterium]
MRRFFIELAGFAALWLGVTAPAVAASTPASLKTFLEREGFGGSQLQRRLGNHLFATTIINGRRTALMIDTGSPRTLIDWGTIEQLRLEVRNSHIPVGGIWGLKRGHYGVAHIANLVMGNCTFLDVPITVADESQINAGPGPHLDGLFGAHEMTQFGAIIDCGRQMIYVNPKGPSTATSQKLAAFLGQRGFVRIPMRWDERHHLQIDAGINGHPAKLIVETGASGTLIAEPIARSSGVSFLPLKTRVYDRDAGMIGINIGRVQELRLGDFRIPDAEVVIARIVTDVGAGLLGEEYLSWNFGIVDVGGMNLYLRHPETGSGKKR